MLCKFKLHCYLFCSASFATVLRSVSVWHSLIRRLQPFTHWYATELLYLVVLYSRVFVFNLYFTFFHLIYKNSLGIVICRSTALLHQVVTGYKKTTIAIAQCASTYWNDSTLRSSGIIIFVFPDAS